MADIDVPAGSIYLKMYQWGLHGVPLDEVIGAVYRAGKDVRQKDMDNWWNGYHNRQLYHGPGASSVFELKGGSCPPPPTLDRFFDTDFEDLPFNPLYDQPDIQNKWVPCSARNKPLIKWSQGCMTMADALAYPNQHLLAENLKGTRTIVIDCDGDHEAVLDMETIGFLWRFERMTHTLMKPKKVREYEGYEDTGCDMPASFHLTFLTDRLTPKIPLPDAHIDVLGNERNQLRYWKNKVWNGREPAWLTPEIWKELQDYARYRKERADGQGH